MVGRVVLSVSVVDSPGLSGFRPNVAVVPGGRFDALSSTADVKLGPCSDWTPTVKSTEPPAHTSSTPTGWTVTTKSGGPQIDETTLTSSMNMPVTSPKPSWCTPNVIFTVWPANWPRLN